jgi:ketosteroid isomerase-like protein
VGRLSTRSFALPLCLVGSLASCGGTAAPISTAASPSAASVAAKSATAPSPASASAAAKPSAEPQAAASAKPSTAAAASGPAAVAARWLDVSNNLDRNAVGALFTDTAVFIDGPPCGLIATFCKGPAAIAKRLDRVEADHGKLAPGGPPQVAGNLVSMRTEGRSDNSQRAGVDRQIVLSNVVVVGDKIAAYVEQADLSDAQTLRYQLFNIQRAQASSSAAPASAKTDPAAVALAWYSGINGGDATATANAFTDNAVLITGGPCAPTTPCVGRDVILQRVQAVIANHAKPTPVGSPLVAGSLVEIRQETSGDAQKQAGVDRIVVLAVETVQGGKISARVEFPDLSDAQTAKYQQYQQTQAASAAARPSASAAASPRPSAN